MSEFTMAHAYLWEDETNIIDYLSRQLLNGKLALVLGAGISAPFGLSDWPTLIERLYTAKDDNPDPEISLEEQAEYFRSTYFSGDDLGFKEIVRDSLYKDYIHDFIELHKNQTIAAIGALVMASFRGNVSRLITLNFDNLLEIYLQYYGYVVSSICNEKHWNSKSDVTIFHPHGYLPIEGTGDFSKKIVFDQESYLQVIGNKDNLWFQKVTTILRSHTCLFIGLSGNDQNLKQLLYYANENHAYEKDQVLYWGIRMTTDDNERKRKIWGNRGVFSLILENYDEHLPEILFQICQKAAILRT
jgi:hypothetical protein